ncbi:MAG: FtsQ-type POTRA domain-containing protein [Pseudomonadota bacterium]
MRGFLKTQNVKKKGIVARHFRAVERILFSLAVVFGGLALLYGLYLVIVFGPFFNVEKVIVAGELTHLNQSQVETLAKVSPGQKLFGVNVQKMHLNLKKHPWVKQATVRRRLPDTVWIYIEEYQPVAIFINKNKPYFVDEQGIAFKQIEAGESKNFEIISGLRNFENQQELQAELKQSLELISLYKKSKFSQILGIAELHYAKPYGFSIITEKGPIEIFLGNSFSQEKFQILDHYPGVIERAQEKIRYIFANNENRIAVGYEDVSQAVSFSRKRESSAL